MKKAAKFRLVVILQLLLVMLVVQIINEVSDGSLRYYGIHPRDLGSLPLIYTSPFIHGSRVHLVNNAVGFATFSLLCMMRGTAFYVKASLFIVTVGGLIVWTLGRPAVHIGASGWIFGLWSLTIALAWFERSILNILISLTVIVIYGSMAFGMLPTDPYISFEAHIAGAFAGVIAASMLARKDRHFKWH